MKEIFKKTLSSPHFLMIVGSNFAAMINFLVSILLTRNLAPAESAKFFAVSAVPPLVFSIFSFVPYKVAISVMGESGNSKFQITSVDFYKHFLVVGLWSTALIILAVPLNFLLNLGDSSLLAGLFFVLFFTAQVNFLSGIFQGLEKFHWLALKDISIAAFKIFALLGFVYVLNFKTAWAALLSEAFAIGVTLIWVGKLGFGPILKFTEIPQAMFSVRSLVQFFSSSLPVIAGVALIGFVTSFDILIAKNLLMATDAGYLIAASTYSKIVFFTCGSVPAIVFLYAAKYSRQADTRKNFRSLMVSLCIVLGIGAAVAIVLGSFKSVLITKMYGESYLQTIGLADYMIAYMLITSLSILLINFLMAQQWIKPLWLVALSYLVFIVSHITLGISDSLVLAWNLVILSAVNLTILAFSVAVKFRGK